MLFGNDEDTKDRIMNDKVDLWCPEWLAMPYEARELCESLLKKIPDCRPTAEKALANEFFK
jgi:hypothetical protein